MIFVVLLEVDFCNYHFSVINSSNPHVHQKPFQQMSVPSEILVQLQIHYQTIFLRRGFVFC